MEKMIFKKNQFNELLIALTLCSNGEFDMDNGAIAFLDILGFKGIWQQRSPEEVFSIMDGVTGEIQKTYKKPLPEKGWGLSEDPFVTILSDTIVIGYKSAENPVCLLLLGNIVYDLIHYFLGFGIFFRGALTYGQYIQERNTFIGPAIDDVASWYEAADWIGIITTPRCNYLIDLFSHVTMCVNTISVQAYVKYDVPGKNGEAFHLNALNWPGYLQASFKKLPEKNQKSDAHKLMKKKFTQQAAFDASVLRKYENTLRFVDFCIDEAWTGHRQEGA
jgi:hypothetical protein